MEQRLVVGAWQSTSSSLSSDRVENINQQLLWMRSEEDGSRARRLAIHLIANGASVGTPSIDSNGDNSPGNSPGPNPQLGENVVIILAVLFVAVFSAASVYLLLRCALYRRAQAASNARALLISQGGDPDDQESSEQGLDAEALAGLPVLTFKLSETAKPGEVDCTICLSEFTENERLRLLPKCSHVFHLDCIDLWLLSHNSCPVCRDGIKADPEAVLKMDEDEASGERMVLTLDQDGHPAVVRSASSRGGLTESGEITMEVRGELKRDRSWSASMNEASRRSSSMRSLSMDLSRQASFRDGSRSERAGWSLNDLSLARQNSLREGSRSERELWSPKDLSLARQNSLREGSRSERELWSLKDLSLARQNSLREGSSRSGRAGGSSSRWSLRDLAQQASLQDGTSRSGRAGSSSSRMSLRAALSAILTTSSAGKSPSARRPGFSSSFRAAPAAAPPAAAPAARSTALPTERPEASAGSLPASESEQPLAGSKASSPGH